MLAVASLIFGIGNGQILKRLGERAQRKVEQKAGDKVDKSIDESLEKKKTKTEDGETKEKTEDGDSKTKTKTEDGETKTKNKGQQPESLQAYSKYDFVPGEKIVAYEDFSNTEIGDFPTKWNTNGTAEVVKLNTKEGKWIKLSKEGVWYPEFITDLPENFTMEFDLGVNNDWNSDAFVLNITNLAKPEDFKNYYHYVSYTGPHTFHIQMKPSNGTVPGWARIQTATVGNYIIDNTIEFKSWDNAAKSFAHVSLWRQKERIRVYMNGEKLFDLPRAFAPNTKYNAITIARASSYKQEDYFVFGNLRLAVGAPDTRNKLITEGKFVTRGILFDVNSDKIKPESFGTLKEIANVLKENGDVRVKIIGHTDSDGKDDANLELSKKRAAAVKVALSSEFGIEASRMETDGLGETKPVGDNNKAEGKAQNRRVEFLKL
jgi:outer membrane protein OmpA-like peptidoglycan-associated protein